MNHTVMNLPRNILILGAGELGIAMLNGFIKQRENHADIRLTVLLRPSSPQGEASASQRERRQQLADWNVEVVTADFSQQTAEQLAEVFAPFDAVINCSGFVGGAGTQLKITRAVLLAGVARYFPWQFGVDYDRIGMGSGQPVWDEQLAVRQLLRSQAYSQVHSPADPQHKTRWVIVSTGMFTSFLFEADFGLVDVAGQTVHALGDADFALTLTTPEDIGLLTAAIFFQQPSIDNQVVYVAGDTLTYRQLTEILGQHYGVPFALKVHDTRELQVKAEQSPGDVVAAYRLAFARPDGVSWDKSTSYNARHAVPVTDVKGWLKAIR